MMRVTQQMLHNNTLNQLNRNLSRLNEAQEQVSTGRSINRPSDNPAGTNLALKLRSELAANEQYQQNADSALSWMEMTDGAMNQASNVLHRANELATQAANGTLSDQDREAISKEVDELREQLIDVSNTKFRGKYIFNGEKTDQIPFPTKGVSNAEISELDNTSLQTQVSGAAAIEYSLSAKEVFIGNNGGENVFNVLETLSANLKNNDQSAISDSLKKVEASVDQVLNAWTSLGARQERMEAASSRLKDANTNLQSLQSKTEDADIAEAVMKLKQEEAVYQASLSATARIIQPSLMDFLR
ncbi:flagellar hook-associated protein FlgL [Pseudalkalibacillus caeni]|nr:flagellar hook-associated protein FlgL [Pseudalkalibacillus caeni]